MRDWSSLLRPTTAVAAPVAKSEGIGTERSGGADAAPPPIRSPAGGPESGRGLDGDPPPRVKELEIGTKPDDSKPPARCWGKGEDDDSAETRTRTAAEEDKAEAR